MPITTAGFNDRTDPVVNDYFANVLLPWLQGADEERFPYHFYDTDSTHHEHYLGDGFDTLNTAQQRRLITFVIQLSWCYPTPEYLIEVRRALAAVAGWTKPNFPELAHCIPGHIVGLGGPVPRLIRNVPHGVQYIAQAQTFLVLHGNPSPLFEMLVALFVSLHGGSMEETFSAPAALNMLSDNGSDCWLF